MLQRRCPGDPPKHRDPSRGASGRGHYDGLTTMTDPAPDTPAETTAPKRFLFLRRRDPADAPPVAGTPQDAPEPAGGEAATVDEERVRPGVLRRRRRQLMTAYEQGIFDLGGLAMELHRRGLLAEDVMRRRAAEVNDLRQQIDDMATRLDAIRAERQERRQGGRGAAVTCPACGARSRSTANFCAACGAALSPATASAAADTAGADQPTTVIVDEQVTTVIADDDPQHTAVITPRDEGDA